MRGKVLTFNDLEGHGLISAENGQRYEFVRDGLAGGLRSVQPGADVDFQLNGALAEAIYVVSSPNLLSGDRNKYIAAVLAFVLGGIGIHKFYLGKTNAGIVMLICGTIGWIVFLPGFAMWLIGIIEFVIYLCKSDQQFHDDYVVGKREWF